MIKTAVKLLIAAALLNATFRAGTAAWTYYQLRDEARQLITFGSTATTGDLQNEILARARAHGVPLEPHNVTVRREGPRTFADATYTQPVELAPGFVYPVTFELSVEALAVRPLTVDDLRP